MSDIFLNNEEIEQIFKTHLKVDSKVVSIETLFTNIRRQPKYDPYYQRNYVWDNDKASYFIESILLGTEIPPLVFFNSFGHVEVIDGRQRFETIKRFIDQEFTLTNNGLKALKELRKKSFDDLSDEVREVFWDTKLRILEFSVVNEPKLDDRKEDLIKKEIFRRYNSGITPLRAEEIDKAIYIYDDTTSFFKKQLKVKSDDYRVVLELFFSDREIELMNKGLTLEKVMEKIRTFLVLHKIPINYFASGKGKKEVIAQFFDQITQENSNPELIYKSFFKKIAVLKEIRKSLTTMGVVANRLMFECLYWAFSVLEVEGISIDKFSKPELSNKVSGYLSNNLDKYRSENSHFYKDVNERYSCTAKFFEEEFGLSFELYLTNKGRSGSSELQKIKHESPHTLTDFETMRLNKPDASTTTIEDICRQMLRGRFLVRPSYQRGEAINRLKSSALIESILLGIKLPPIFVYKREDGVSEVVDGQQRLLSILGFIGQEFIDEDGVKVKSEKHEFKLSKLPILKELKGKKFVDLPEGLQNRIYDFDISLVNIDEKINPHFDPIDLFIRLNNKPYPIRDNTFEMWNSYVDKEVISSIKDNTGKHAPWFYLRVNNSRMENEEMYTTLAYLELQKNETITKRTTEFLDIYQRGERINSRIKDKSDITKLLNTASVDEAVKEQFLKSIKSLESFVRKVKTILIDRDITDNQYSFLQSELDMIFNPKGTKVLRRTSHSFYMLWYILSDINYEMIKVHRIRIKEDLIKVFNFIRRLPVEDINGKGSEHFHGICQVFWDKYSVQSRSLSLSSDEKMGLIKKQDNLCPLCKAPIFAGDDVEIDHIKPLAIGGRDTFFNLQATHKDCNRKKRAAFAK